MRGKEEAHMCDMLVCMLNTGSEVKQSGKITWYLEHQRSSKQNNTKEVKTNDYPLCSLLHNRNQDQTHKRQLIHSSGINNHGAQGKSKVSDFWNLSTQIT